MTNGQGRNYNGAGYRRFVGMRRNGRIVAGAQQYGTREQRRSDLRAAFGAGI